MRHLSVNVPLYGALVSARGASTLVPIIVASRLQHVNATALPQRSVSSAMCVCVCVLSATLRYPSRTVSAAAPPRADLSDMLLAGTRVLSHRLYSSSHFLVAKLTGDSGGDHSFSPQWHFGVYWAGRLGLFMLAHVLMAGGHVFSVSAAEHSQGSPGMLAAGVRHLAAFTSCFEAQLMGRRESEGGVRLPIVGPRSPSHVRCESLGCYFVVCPRLAVWWYLPCCPLLVGIRFTAMLASILPSSVEPRLGCLVH